MTCKSQFKLSDPTSQHPAFFSGRMPFPLPNQQCQSTEGNWLIYTLPLYFNGHFPAEPRLTGAYWSKGWQGWWWQLDYWSYKSCKVPVKSSLPTNQHPVFLQAGCPSCRPTNSVKALKGKYHVPWTCLPQEAHMGVYQLCLWPLIAPGYLGEGCHASHQPSDASTLI